VSTERRSVLVVDDSEDLRELISMVIRRRKQTWQVVGTAAEGQEAVDRARETQPDIILLDIAMPVMDGLEALPLIKQVAPESKVIMLSGYPFAVAGQGAMDAGADGYLEKSNLVRGLIPSLEELAASGTGNDTGSGSGTA
jgi:YesN/AraC family two-component response regulator